MPVCRWHCKQDCGYRCSPCPATPGKASMTTQQDHTALGLSNACWAGMAMTQGRGLAGRAHRGVCGCSDACCEGWMWQTHGAQQLLNLLLSSALRICLHPPQHSLSPMKDMNMVLLMLGIIHADIS